MNIVLIKANRTNREGYIITEDVCKNFIQQDPHLLWNEEKKQVEVHPLARARDLVRINKLKNEIMTKPLFVKDFI